MFVAKTLIWNSCTRKDLEKTYMSAVDDGLKTRTTQSVHGESRNRDGNSTPQTNVTSNIWSICWTLMKYKPIKRCLKMNHKSHKTQTLWEYSIWKYLHDISYDDTVDNLWSQPPCSEGSFGCVLGQICCTVVPQHAAICTKWSALSCYDKNTCEEKVHFCESLKASTTLKKQEDGLHLLYLHFFKKKKKCNYHSQKNKNNHSIFFTIKLHLTLSGNDTKNMWTCCNAQCLKSRANQYGSCL